METLFEQGIQLFNQARYFEAHEVLESYWKQLPADDYRKLVQGLIQCAVTLHLLDCNRLTGAEKVWLRAQKNFKDNTARLDNIDLDKLIHDMYKIFEGFQEGSEINVKISCIR